MKISQLYKYPIKSLTPLKSESLVLNSNGYIDGDRLFGFRFQNAGARDNYEWQRKTSFAALMHMPQIARLKVDFDETSRNLIIKNTDEIIVDANIDLGFDVSVKKRIRLAGINDKIPKLGKLFTEF